MQNLQHLAPIAVALVAGLVACGSAQQPATLEATFNQAVSAMQAGEYQQAETGFHSVLAADPENVAALADLGVLYSHTHRFAKAVDVDQRALAHAPGNAALLMNLGLAWMKQGDYPKARTYFAQLHAADGANTRATLLLASCMILGDAPQGGLDLLQRDHLERADPSMATLALVAYVRLNRRAEADALLQQLSAAGSTRAQVSFLLGESLHDGHQLQEAAEAFHATLLADPAYPGAHRELGKVYLSMQRFTDAEVELRTALQGDAKDAEAAYFLGALLVQTARDAEGVTYLDRASQALPDSWAIPFYLGKAKLAQKQPAQAAVLLQQAATMNPDEPQVFYLLSGALRATGRLDAAKQAMQRVQELHSSALDAEKRSMERRVELIR